MWERYCCLTFFPIVAICLSCEDIARQICAMLCRWRIFGDFLRPVFSASRVQHVSDVYPKFALRPHHVWKYGRHQTSNLRRLRLGEEKKKIESDRQKKPQYENIMACPRAAIINVNCRPIRSSTLEDSNMNTYINGG